ncbi:MAG: hypothetical protein NVSMB65_21260 [Chloroflexota bacterium]
MGYAVLKVEGKARVYHFLGSGRGDERLPSTPLPGGPLPAGSIVLPGDYWVGGQQIRRVRYSTVQVIAPLGPGALVRWLEPLTEADLQEIAQARPYDQETLRTSLRARGLYIFPTPARPADPDVFVVRVAAGLGRAA